MVYFIKSNWKPLYVYMYVWMDVYISLLKNIKITMKNEI